MKNLLDKLLDIPHLFAKVMVIWCVACGTVACFWSLRILSHTGQDPAALLGVILAFFGGELLLMCLKTILKEKKPPATAGTGDTILSQATPDSSFQKEPKGPAEG